MTLDEAIKHAKEVASEKRYEYQECVAVHDIESAEECGRCGEQHEQLAEWLKDYKRLLEQHPSDTVSRGAYEQVMWERDVAIGQLKELGYGLGQKIEPCDDAISREAVIEWLKAKDIIKLSSQEETARKELKALPPVTPQKYGHWIWNFDKGYCKCSECGIGMGHKEFDYCPNCGAKMQESEDKK